ncbi:MAG TPA: hypothetical protein VE974_27165 [Thermoanaerobaculia bacterium]|nr:hypothetical protein [Thermoanaerobaculia bacterium]
MGIPGAFSGGLDTIAVTAIWGAMLLAVAEKSGHRQDRAFAMKLATGVAAGVAAYVGGSKIFTWALTIAFPGAGALAAMGFNGILNYLFTYRFGHAITAFFEHGDYDVSDAVTAAAAILPLLTHIPTASEATDVFAIAAEPINRKTFEEFIAAVAAARGGRLS